VTDRFIACVVAGCLFVVTVAIGLAGADKPPPIGFLWLVGALAIACLVGFSRLGKHLRARNQGVRGLGRRVAFEGALVGLAIMLALSLLGGGVHEVPVTFVSQLIGAGVLACAGGLVALAAWFAAVQMQKHFGRRPEPPA
jgi:drug/metabolite transporter (DMT)-like permease